jgi:uncharacterized protein
MKIDPRSFHVFTCENEYLLFDRSTEATFSIPQEFFHLLRDYELGLTSQLPVDLASEINSLARKGMFQFTPIREEEQAEQIDALMSHKSIRLQLLMAQGCNLGCRYNRKLVDRSLVGRKHCKIREFGRI